MADHDPATLHHPRILCLHGGGVNKEVFRLQCRALIHHLPHFRLVFADGPFFCDAGPGILPVYADHAPFRRWLRWLPAHPPVDDHTAVTEIAYALARALASDPGHGPCVALLGFSQGAKLAASLLYEQQQRRRSRPSPSPPLLPDTDYKFGILLAGRSPLVSLSPHTSASPACIAPGAIADSVEGEAEADAPAPSPPLAAIPTIHVHGLRDPGLPLHRRLRDRYCDPAAAVVLEWDGAHRVPLRCADVEPLVREIYRVARAQGVDV